MRPKSHKIDIKEKKLDLDSLFLIGDANFILQVMPILSFYDLDNLETEILSTSILNDKFIPYLQHYLYKPNGIRAKQVADTTLVGKIN